MSISFNRVGVEHLSMTSCFTNNFSMFRNSLSKSLHMDELIGLSVW